ncbi:MAG: alpha/beta hydrolase [Armatimonadota bacterium]
MSWGTINFRSQVLNRPMSFNFILPDPWAAGPGPHPVFYLLHGYSDDHHVWLRNTRLGSHEHQLPLIVVMPDGEHSFYCDAYDGDAFEQYLLEEVMQIVERQFSVRRGQRARCIGGLSMGGFGAMTLGLRHPDLFCSIGAHSSAMAVARHRVKREGMGEELRRIFGPKRKSNAHRWRNDPFTLAEKIKRKDAPAIYFDCGTEDGLLEGNRQFAQLLTRRKIPHEYHEYPGAHTWQYWDEHIWDSLAFHCRHLRLKPPR